ncbi:MAG: M28 family peptidase [Balneolaceae bacterium]|nr:M28 family peptidase [Balneolaceae bacterium]
MKYASRFILVAGMALALGACSTGRESLTEPPSTDAGPTERLLSYQELITEEYLRPRLTAFSHDSMEGRETGTRGLRMAADYLAREYRELGLQPVGDNNSYFQHFELNATRTDSAVYVVRDTTGSRVLSRSVAAPGSRARFVPAFGGGTDVSGEVVFAGFGVNDPERGVQHLEGASLQDKWVMVYEDIPGVVEGDTLLSPDIDSRSRFRSLLNEAGARGVLLIPGMSAAEFEESAAEEAVGYGEPQGMRLAYRDRGSENGSMGPALNVVHPVLAAEMLGLEGEGALRSHHDRLLEEIAGFRARPTGYSLEQNFHTSTVTVPTKNVAAFLEGGDPELKDEVVVLTSHYDHVGIGQPDENGDRIYNGADDDGSGTIGLLNVARALAEARDDGLRPQRSILFLNVAGEEKGLLGSRYYSDHPIFPIEKTVTNLNVDMIGRVDRQQEEQGVSDYTYIIGGRIISSDLARLLEEANERSGKLVLSDRYNDLRDPNQFYRRSDHWNFGRLGVPFVFFFTGVHEDYHRPSDEVHKIRFDMLVRRTQTIYASAVLVANSEDPPVVDNQEFIEITRTESR